MFDLRHGIAGLIWLTILFVIELVVAFFCAINNLLPLYATMALVGLICVWYHNKRYYDHS